uniref:peptidoglycan-binding protein n=1 Tax=Alkalicoccus luteus TaxID=1237094 RepID=UPI0040344106
FYNGARGEYIRELKYDLTELGFGNFPSSPSNAFGPVTMGVVEDFQRAYGLEVTGLPTEEMLQLIEDELRPAKSATYAGEFYNGARGEHIRKLKVDLTALGFGNFPSSPSNAFGPVTMSVVEDFQRAYGLDVTGLPTSNMLHLITEELNAFYDGAQGEHIRELKQDLTTLGFGNFPMTPSNAFGSVTIRVVKEFQQYYGLRDTGIPDSQTLKMINDIKNSSYSSGQRGEHIRSLKNDLTRLGYGNFPSNPSDAYGSVTASVVRDFQAANRLKVNGIGDPVTIKLVEEQINNLSIGTGTVTATSLNVRRGPSTNYSVITGLPNGTVVNLIEKQSNGWYRITHASITESPAYVSGAFLQLDTDELTYPYKNGDRGEEIVEMKQQLTKLGFGSFPSTPSNAYGSTTTRVVREFQEYYRLAVTGEFSESDADFVHSILNSHYVDGGRHENVRELKNNLSRLGFGNFPSNPSNGYGSVTANVVREFQQHHDLVVNGIGDPRTMQKINDELSKFGVQIDYRQYQMTLTQMLNRQMSLRPQTDLYGGGWQDARAADVRRFLDPQQFTLDPGHQDMFQFLVLSQTSGVPASQLNNILRNRGILHNTGDAFKRAAESQGVNDIYLISHAILETGHGTSILSNGSIEVGQIESNKWVSVQPQSNGSTRTFILERRFNEADNTWRWIRTRNDNFDTSKIDMRKTYNMFGIEAVDSDPYTRGSVRAYREGWFTPQDSIRGGAQFISNNYLNRGQDTIYKMRWDPDFHEAALNSNISINRSHFYQYATDIGWASKQTTMIRNLYSQINNPYLPFEVPVYR